MPAWRPLRAMMRGAVLALALMTAGSLWLGKAGLAQAGNAELDATSPAARALSEDILIEGLGFSRLILRIEADEAMRSRDGHQSLLRLVEKNLCWTGLFTLTGGVTGYCTQAGEPPRVDMRVALSIDEAERGGETFRMRLLDNGPEQLMLFEDQMPQPQRIIEDELMDLVNRLAERVTGDYGLLGSTIAFVLKQPGYKKLVAATTTHGQRLRRISRNEEINLLPHFSPQGHYVTYTVLGQDGSKVYLHDLRRGAGAETGHYVTGPGTLNTGGSFSPDGSQLAVTMSTGRSADLYLVDVASGEQTQLTDRLGIETQADWSPDGRYLVFVSDRSDTPQIYRYDLETGEELRLTFNSRYNADPKWSPDGRHILFTSRATVQDERSGGVAFVDQIRIMDAYGDNVRPVTGGRYDAEQAEWSPDGNQIVFSANRTGTYKLYAVSIDGQNLRRLTNTPPDVEETSPSWTRRRLIR